MRHAHVNAIYLTLVGQNFKNKNKFAFTKIREHITTKNKPDRRNLRQISHTVFHEDKAQ